MPVKKKSYTSYIYIYIYIYICVCVCIGYVRSSVVSNKKIVKGTFYPPTREIA